MSRDYDPALKALVDVEPASWLPLAVRAAALVSVITADVAAVISAAADAFLRVHALEVLLQGVQGMKESSTYQAIVAEGRAEGRAEEARRLLFLLGQESYGVPDVTTRTAIDAIADVERLEHLVKEMRRASSWHELLGRAGPRRRHGRRKPGR
jgi:hypothetical protein